MIYNVATNLFERVDSMLKEAYKAQEYIKEFKNSVIGDIYDIEQKLNLSIWGYARIDDMKITILPHDSIIFIYYKNKHIDCISDLSEIIKIAKLIRQNENVLAQNLVRNVKVSLQPSSVISES